MQSNPVFKISIFNVNNFLTHQAYKECFIDFITHVVEANYYAYFGKKIDVSAIITKLIIYKYILF